MVSVPSCHQLWRVDRALYGFRRSPRLWSKFRDRRLRDACIPFGPGFLRLRQTRADANVWAIVYKKNGEVQEVRGYLNIYVDDVLYAGLSEEIRAIHQWLTTEWKASDLTWASKGCGASVPGLGNPACRGRGEDRPTSLCGRAGTSPQATGHKRTWNPLSTKLAPGRM